MQSVAKITPMAEMIRYRHQCHRCRSIINVLTVNNLEKNLGSSLEPNLFLCISDESYLSNDNREHKKQRAQSKASRQAELKR